MPCINLINIVRYYTSYKHKNSNFFCVLIKMNDFTLSKKTVESTKNTIKMKNITVNTVIVNNKAEVK